MVIINKIYIYQIFFLIIIIFKITIGIIFTLDKIYYFFLLY